MIVLHLLLFRNPVAIMTLDKRAIHQDMHAPPSKNPHSAFHLSQRDFRIL